MTTIDEMTSKVDGALSQVGRLSSEHEQLLAEDEKLRRADPSQREAWEDLYGRARLLKAETELQRFEDALYQTLDGYHRLAVEAQQFAQSRATVSLSDPDFQAVPVTKLGFIKDAARTMPAGVVLGHLRDAIDGGDLAGQKLWFTYTRHGRADLRPHQLAELSVDTQAAEGELRQLLAQLESELVSPEVQTLRERARTLETRIGELQSRTRRFYREMAERMGYTLSPAGEVVAR